MLYLSFSSEYFSTLPKFSKFVTNVLSHRNDHVEVSYLYLVFRGKVSQVFVRKIMNYASFHNVQEMSVTCLLENNIEFPLSLFSSQSLKDLSLTKEIAFQTRPRSFFKASISYSLKATSFLELPALTTLYLYDVTLCCDDNNDKCTRLFSKCANLRYLSLEKCRMIGSNCFTICHPTLSELELKHLDFNVNVVAPHLKNLSVSASSTKSQYLISAPNLASLVYKGYHPWQLNIDGFNYLEEADFSIPSLLGADAHKMVCLLQELHNVQILKLSLGVVEEEKFSWPLEQSPKKVTLSTEVKNYLLDSSQSATLTIVLLEEITAKKLMSEVRVLLKQEKANTEINRAHLEQGKAQLETKTPLQVEGPSTQIESCWENLGVQIEERRRNDWLIFTKLERIEELLTVLPASRRAMIQPCFSNLCAEADFVTSKSMDCVKVQCDEYQSLLSACFHELATTLDQSS